jgi:hypothetical protein
MTDDRSISVTELIHSIMSTVVHEYKRDILAHTTDTLGWSHWMLLPGRSCLSNNIALLIRLAYLKMAGLFFYNDIWLVQLHVVAAGGGPRQSEANGQMVRG